MLMPSHLGIQLDNVDTAFTVIFTAELAINAYASWFRYANRRFRWTGGGARAIRRKQL